MTGKHIVRDVMCRICHVGSFGSSAFRSCSTFCCLILPSVTLQKKVGWMYEFAMEDSQRYKEARIILEKALVDEEDGFPDPSGALETHEQPPS